MKTTTAYATKTRSSVVKMSMPATTTPWPRKQVIVNSRMLHLIATAIA